jgi:predicted CXXCH cytochrome family protein
LTVLLAVAFGTAAIAGITGSKHDFSSQGWSGGRICVPCHVPHNADPGGRPLWNHEMTVATFTMYPTVPGGNQPATESKLCLSCHDGTVAIDSFGGNAGSTFVTGDYLLGTDLSEDHPIAVQYPVADPLDDYVDDPTAASNVKLVDVSGEDRVECVSCHDPHEGNGGVPPEFLREPIAASALCLSCHEK